jgi:hypothetical protein
MPEFAASGRPEPKRTARQRAILAAAVVTLLAEAALVAASVLLIGTHRLPDVGEVLSTSWSSTPWVKKGGKAIAVLRLRRRDHLPISSRFIVVAWGGQVIHDGPSAGPLPVPGWVPSESVKPAADWNAREVTVKLEMTPSRPGELSGDIIVYNDAPVWRWCWSKRLPRFVEQRLAGFSVWTWKVQLPPFPEEATIQREK